MQTLADRSPVAGRWLLRYCASATNYVGRRSDKGRLRPSHNPLLWRDMLKLLAEGVSWLDFGGINAASMPGVTRFELGVRSEVLTLAGT